VKFAPEAEEPVSVTLVLEQVSESEAVAVTLAGTVRSCTTVTAVVAVHPKEELILAAVIV
jgi:hypothetical protein